MIGWKTIAALFLTLPIQLEADASSTATSRTLNVSVVEVVARHPPYADFCRRHPQECDLSGPSVVQHNADTMQTISATNAAVNREVQFVLDAEQYDVEEYWTLPSSGRGDCEDKALEKRSRLAKQGLPRGAMRLAIGFHKQLLISHCLLSLETSDGTYTLDSLTDEVFVWDQAPYNYEMRERPDGKWDRFDQTQWAHE